MGLKFVFLIENIDFQNHLVMASLHSDDCLSLGLWLYSTPTYVWFACSYVDPAGVASLALFHFRLSPLHSRPPPKGSPFVSCWRFPTGAHRPRRLPCASCPRMDCELGFRSNHLRSRPPPQGVPCARCWWSPAGAHRLGRPPCAEI